MDEIPLIPWPGKSGVYKVVQFLRERGEQQYLRFGREPDFDYHDLIQRRFADEVGIPYQKIPKVGGGSTISVLPPESPFRMVGAGRCSVKLEERIAMFLGESLDYSVGIDKGHLENIKQYFPQWSFRY